MSEEHAATSTLVSERARRVDEEHVKRVVRKMLNGLVVPLLGVGVNIPGRPANFRYTGPEAGHLPSGPELASFLANHFEYPRLAGERDLVRVSQFLDVMEGSGELYQALHQVFDAGYSPGPVHRFLARLQQILRECGKPRQVILTTNYDDALERAFRDIGEEYDLVTYACAYPAEHRGRFVHRAPGASEPVPIERPNEYEGLDPWRRAVILKMHGAVVRDEGFERDNYVITEDDYIDYLAHTDITNLLPHPIPQQLRNSHFLFLGYAMRDWSLRVILRRIWGTQGLDFPSWSIQVSPDELETKFWEDQGVAIYDVDVADYVEKLRVGVVNRCGIPFVQ
jgi:SIR2-like domain